MKKIIAIILLLFITKMKIDAQERSFVIEGCIPGMKDGISISLINSETAESLLMVEDTVRNGCFKLTGRVEHPTKCCLTTNNLRILSPEEIEKGQNIKWTYTTIFVDNVPMNFEAESYDSIPVDAPIGKDFKVTGGSVQSDYNEYNLMLLAEAEKNKEVNDSILHNLQLKFIHSHPNSTVSVMLANDMLQIGYRLHKEQIIELEKAIVSAPEDPKRFVEFQKNCQTAKRSAVSSSIVNLSLHDINGKACNLTDVVPKGKYVLIDFWASWCGICLEGIPEIKNIAKQHPDDFIVIGISADTKIQAWKNSIKKEGLTWKQYILTPQGLKDFSAKYLTRGVPYYLIVNPQGNVINAPEHPEDIKNQIDTLCK